MTAGASIWEERRPPPGPEVSPVRREKRRVPSEMKGAHPINSREVGSQAPCERSRGLQQKRGRKAMGCNPWLRSGGPQRTANPDVASSINGEAEPLGEWAKAACDGKDSTRAPSHSPGVAGAARRDRNALNTGDLDRCGWQPQPTAQGRKPRRADRRGVGRVRSTDEGGENRRREGALLDDATPAGKERRLWQH